MKKNRQKLLQTASFSLVTLCLSLGLVSQTRAKSRKEALKKSVSFDSEKASFLALKVQTPNTFYQLKKTGNYLRFRLYGEQVGFNIKSCHAEIVHTIRDQVKKSFLRAGRVPASLPDKDGHFAIITHDDDRPWRMSQERFRLSSFPELGMKLHRLMKEGKRRCP